MPSTFSRSVYLAGLIGILLLWLLMTTGCRSMHHGTFKSAKAEKADLFYERGDYKEAIKRYEKIISFKTLFAIARNFGGYEKYELEDIFVRLKLANAYIEARRPDDAITLLLETQKIIKELRVKNSNISEYELRQIHKRISHLLDDAFYQRSIGRKSYAEIDKDKSDNMNDFVSLLFYRAMRDLNQGHYNEARQNLKALGILVPESTTIKALELYAAFGPHKPFSTSNKEAEDVLKETKKLLKELEAYSKSIRSIWNSDKLILLARAKTSEFEGIVRHSVIYHSRWDLMREAIELYDQAEKASLVIDKNLQRILNMSSLPESYTHKKSTTGNNGLLSSELLDLDERAKEDASSSKERLMQYDDDPPEIVVDPQPWVGNRQYQNAIISGEVKDQTLVARILVNNEEVNMIRPKSNLESGYDIVDFAVEMELDYDGGEIIIEAFDNSGLKSEEIITLTLPETWQYDSIGNPQFKERWALFLAAYKYQDTYIDPRLNSDDSFQLREMLCKGIPEDQVVRLIDEDATKSRIMDNLNKMKKVSVKNRFEEMLIYLDLLQEEDFDEEAEDFDELESFLLPYDVDLNHISQTSIKLNDFLAKLEEINAGRILIVANIKIDENQLRNKKIVILSSAENERLYSGDPSFLSNMINGLENLALYDPEPDTFWSKEVLPSFFELLNEKGNFSLKTGDYQQNIIFNGNEKEAKKFIIPGVDFRKRMYDKIKDLLLREELSRKEYTQAMKIISTKNSIHKKQDKEIAKYIELYTNGNISLSYLKRKLKSGE